jgi:hypothetical protein
MIPAPLILSEYITCIVAVANAPLENPDIVTLSLSAFNEGRLKSLFNIRSIFKNLYEIAHERKFESEGQFPIYESIYI